MAHFLQGTILKQSKAMDRFELVEALAEKHKSGASSPETAHAYALGGLMADFSYILMKADSIVKAYEDGKDLGWYIERYKEGLKYLEDKATCTE